MRQIEKLDDLSPSTEDDYSRDILAGELRGIKSKINELIDAISMIELDLKVLSKRVGLPGV